MIAKAPLRISLFGGGSDLPMYRELTGSGGCVLNCTIDQYVTAIQEDDGVYGVSSVAPGSGLGGSGAWHVAKALHTDPNLYGWDLFEAAWACETEANPYAGWQDVAAATFGGLNLYALQDDDLRIDYLHLPRDLSERLLLFSTGITRQAAPILELQAKLMHQNLEEIQASVHLAYHAAYELTQRRIASLGPLLHEAWGLKRKLALVSNDRIHSAYAAARQAGASGGKLCGAGGGGYMLFYVEPDAQMSVRRAMAGLQLDELPFSLTRDGAKLV